MMNAQQEVSVIQESIWLEAVNFLWYVPTHCQGHIGFLPSHCYYALSSSVARSEGKDHRIFENKYF